jgi:biotin transporter BioY
MIPIPLISPAFLIGWIVASLVIGLLGKNRKFGFCGNFLLSFIFSPLVGLIILLASDKKMKKANL